MERAEKIKIAHKLSEPMLKKLENIKKYNKSILLDLLIFLNKKYFKIKDSILTQNINKFFMNVDKLNDIKILTTIITFQHIFITTYTNKFGILTKKENREKFIEFTFTNNKHDINNKIEKIIFDSCAISGNMYYFNKTIYASVNNYYYLITLMLVFNLFNIYMDILVGENNLILLKFDNGTIIKCVHCPEIKVTNFNERLIKLYYIYDFIDDKIKLDDDIKISLKVSKKVIDYNTEFGHISKYNNIEHYKNIVTHRYYNSYEMCVLSYILYTILYTDNYCDIKFSKKLESIQKSFDLVFNNQEFKEISWKNKNIVYIEYFNQL